MSEIRTEVITELEALYREEDKEKDKIDLSQTKKIELDGSCNTSDEILLAQVNQNIRRGLRQVKPHDINPNMAILVCGGPSLEMTKDALVRSHWAGGKIICVNGTYDWCIRNNLKPSMMILLDARETSTRFVEQEVLGCKYLLASQCHPRAFELCKDRDTYIWHACSGGDVEVEILNEYYFGYTYPVTIGTTVGVRSISLLRMLGFNRIQIFGLDSCWLEGENHSYPHSTSFENHQYLNDKEFRNQNHIHIPPNQP